MSGVFEIALNKLRQQRQRPVFGVGAATAAAAANPATPAVTFDAVALRAAGLLCPEYEEIKLSREFRQIKRPLIARALGRGAARLNRGSLIMVASAMSGEGKSFTSVNLAISLAMEKDLSVLLVDADVAKPHISRVLGLGDAPGLLDVLREPQLSLEQVILPTDLPTLSVLPAGKGSMEATELLASRRMEQVAAALEDRDGRRIVLFDSPPLMQTNESHVLAQVAGQILIVVQAETTPQPVVLDAIETLKGHPGVSLVLNQSKRTSASYYYYGYGSDRPDQPDSR
jgi:exopolysaccharide/PEP-CTERM locus tyrosine autokinase